MQFFSGSHDAMKLHLVDQRSVLYLNVLSEICTQILSILFLEKDWFSNSLIDTEQWEMSSVQPFSLSFFQTSTNSLYMVLPPMTFNLFLSILIVHQSSL